MAYALSFSKQSVKELEKINEPYYTNLKQAIIDLTENPRPYGYVKLKGRSGYRIRVGTYSVIYEIFDTRTTIDIITIGHRKDIYK